MDEQDTAGAQRARIGVERFTRQQMQRDRASEAEINRHLRLEIETLRAAQRIEKLATQQLGMIEPGLVKVQVEVVEAANDA